MMKNLKMMKIWKTFQICQNKTKLTQQLRK